MLTKTEQWDDMSKEYLLEKKTKAYPEAVGRCTSICLTHDAN